MTDPKTHPLTDTPDKALAYFVGAANAVASLQVAFEAETDPTIPRHELIQFFQEFTSGIITVQAAKEGIDISPYLPNMDLARKAAGI